MVREPMVRLAVMVAVDEAQPPTAVVVLRLLSQGQPIQAVEAVVDRGTH